MQHDATRQTMEKEKKHGEVQRDEETKNTVKDLFPPAIRGAPETYYR